MRRFPNLLYTVTIDILTAFSLHASYDVDELAFLIEQATQFKRSPEDEGSAHALLNNTKRRICDVFGILQGSGCISRDGKTLICRHQHFFIKSVARAKGDQASPEPETKLRREETSNFPTSGEILEAVRQVWPEAGVEMDISRYFPCSEQLSERLAILYKNIHHLKTGNRNLSEELENRRESTTAIKSLILRHNTGEKSPRRCVFSRMSSPFVVIRTTSQKIQFDERRQYLSVSSHEKVKVLTESDVVQGLYEANVTKTVHAVDL